MAVARRVVAFDIPAGALNSALLSFANKAGIQLFYDAAPLGTLRSNGVSGTFSVSEGLALLLAGTGLTYRFTGANSVALATAQETAQDAGSGPVTIGPVQVGGTAASFDIQMPPDNGYQAKRILSATKTETELRDVPQSVSVVTRQQMDDQAIQNLEGAVRYVPGVGFAQGEGNRDTAVFRGNSTTADFFLDGIRDDVEYYRDLYNIERVEIVKGPNAMIFGRGGVGGLINRVTRQADWTRTREAKVETGSNAHYRGSFDVGQGVDEAVALRLTGVYEDSESYRNGVELRRWGLNPTASFRLGTNTLLQVGYEHFQDDRVADRGIPSFRGRPFETGTATFFGDPERSPVKARVDAVSAAVEHRFDNGISLRNRTRYADYDKSYQNVFPGAVNAAGTSVAISAYNNAQKRKNLINQTDVTFNVETGPVRHTVLVGAEYGRQVTDNFRNTGYFTSLGANVTSVNVSTLAPTISLPVTFRQSATDADNHGVATTAAFYAQDQIELSRQFQIVAGLRYENFDVDFRNNRNGQKFTATDNLLSPRLGLIYKPIDAVSLYASYSLTYLPRAGAQLSSLSLTTQSLDPEKFTNYEIGAKWDVLPDLSLTAALYRLDRTNVAITDSLDPTKSILVDGQRTKGIELSASGKITDKWSAIASYAYQDGEITAAQSATVPAGSVLANLPKHNVALWNRYDVTPQLGGALGVVYQSKRYTTTDNTVSMPGFTRLDGALFYKVTDAVTAQLNVENILNRKYYAQANSNNNITPGAPRAFKVGLTSRF